MAITAWSAKVSTADLLAVNGFTSSLVKTKTQTGSPLPARHAGTSPITAVFLVVEHLVVGSASRRDMTILPDTVPSCCPCSQREDGHEITRTAWSRSCDKSSRRWKMTPFRLRRPALRTRQGCREPCAGRMWTADHLSTSAVAVGCWRASPSSMKRRTFSIAITPGRRRSH